VEIEPDGQQFLNAKDGEAGPEDVDSRPSPPPPPPVGGSARTTTIVIVVLLVVVVGIGGVAFLTLTGDDEGRRELETSAAGDVDIRDRAEATTTTEAPRETTTLPPTTESPTDEPVPFPDFGQPSPPAVGPAPVPGATTCPGGGIATQVVSTSITQTSASSVDLVITGSAVNNTTAPVVLDISLTITHNGTSQPKPWVSKVNQSRPTVSPGETSNWTFTGTLNGGTSASVSAIGGGFRWADPAHASCPTQ
jgi:hypothetical protein